MNIVPHPSAGPQAPKLLDRMRSEIRVRHYSIRAEEAYLGWARRFFLFHRRQPMIPESQKEQAVILSDIHSQLTF